MKKALTVFTLSLGLLLAVSCSKKEITFTPTMSANVNGTMFIAMGNNNMKESTVTSDSVHLYSFTAIANYETMTFTIPGVTVGTYTFGPGANDARSEYEGVGTSAVEYFTDKFGPAIKGSIIVSSNSNNTISGTFSGTFYNRYGDSTVITYGQFINLAYGN
jgi:hypothetical protein